MTGLHIRIGSAATTLALMATGLLVGAAPAQAALPTVDMARVLVAAQVEPACGQTSGLSDNASTVQVQQALVAKGLKTTTDGWFGNESTTSYAAWQRSLGYSGIDANGLPGTTSLTTLGSGRFTVTDAVDVGSRNSSYGGKRVNTRTRVMLQAADDLLPDWNFTLIQGSYHTGTSASAGSHDGGGVVDVNVAGLSTTQRWQQVKALRSVGFAAWLRTPSQGPWGYHIHAVAIGDPDLWQTNGGHTARDQVCDYWRGRNGLVGHASDDTPAAYQVPFTWWEKQHGGSPTPPAGGIPDGATGWDTATKVTASGVACMKGHGYSFGMLYSNFTSTDWRATYAALTANGMQAVLQQGWVNSAFWTNPATGTTAGRANVESARSVGYPQGADLFLDVEGMQSGRSTVIAWINNWAKEIAAAGYTPGVYSGLPSPLHSSDLSSSVLPQVKVYWKSQSSAAPDPASGYVVQQALTTAGPCGFSIDADTAHSDNYGTRLIGSGGGSGGGGTPPPPPPPSDNPYTIAQVCGTGSRVIDSHALSGAKVYLTYNSATGNNCVATMATADQGAVTINAKLSVQGGSSSSSTGQYHYYAGPVVKYARDSCVKWGGSYGSSSWTSGWGHCGVESPNPYTIAQVCGSSSRVIDSHTLSGAKVYLTYNSATGNNCVATMSTADRGAVTTSATLSVRGGTTSSSTGKYHFYAGPVVKYARNTCVKWGGSYASSSWTSNWGHC